MEYGEDALRHQFRVFDPEPLPIQHHSVGRLRMQAGRKRHLGGEDQQVLGTGLYTNRVCRYVGDVFGCLCAPERLYWTESEISADELPHPWSYEYFR